MPVEHQEAFMKLHKHDGSVELVGCIRTNGISTTRPKNRDARLALCNPNTVYHWHTDTLSLRVYTMRAIPPGTKITISYGDTLASATERAKYCALWYSFMCMRPILQRPSPSQDLRKAPQKDKWIQPAVKQVQELEEEGLQAPELYKRTLHLLVNAYTHLQDVDKALFYVKKLKPVYKAREGVDLPAMYLSKSGLKSSPGYMAAAMQKNFKLPPGAPPMLVMAFS
ncbi:hypothetical protein BT96DRAFT_1000437 [Gymnopus androsaceus JB14]|uniref:SET domain-containing protein n=1 Tax=Gymnopus androsaceus JB14 TaxID=1447944 RepID=A0A6A4H3M5_9AGAR|nr:hypothetical protein BT96DRAFT_1000437 [Gymnopus androsaceus JB14]